MIKMFMDAKNFCRIITLLVAFLLPVLSASAMDIIRINHDISPTDSRTLYKIDILNKVMQATKDKYGPYKIIMQGPATTTSRAILEVKSGATINTFLAITTQEWEKNTIPIRIPVRLGLLNYRLLATTKEKLHLFDDVKDIEDLKKLKVGMRTGWVTTEILKDAGFNLFEANSYEGLFYMLSTGRIDYFPRGMNEVFNEIDDREDTLTNLAVEPNLAVYIPAPYYFFVSPNDKKLAQRISEGLEIIIAKNVLQEVFIQYYGDDIKRSKLEQRSIIHVGNPTLSEKTPFDKPHYWLNFEELSQ